jgi:PEP-CTERM motif
MTHMNPLNYLSQRSTVRSLIVAGTICLLIQVANAQLLQEGFNYTDGTNLGDNPPWTGTSATSLAISYGNLTYGSLFDLGGNQLAYTGAGAAATDLNTFSAGGISSGDVYMSFLIQCLQQNSGGGNNYLMSLTAGAGPAGGSDPLSIYTGTSGATGWKIGIRHQGVASGAAYSPKLDFNTTYFVVVDYSFVAGTANDIVRLYLNPLPGDVQPGTATATQSTGTGPVDATSLTTLGFRAGQTTSGGNYLIDNIMVGTSWGDVTTVVPEPSTFVLSGLGILGLLLARRARR